jgi:hypothetical protein
LGVPSQTSTYDVGTAGREQSAANVAQARRSTAKGGREFPAESHFATHRAQPPAGRPLHPQDHRAKGGRGPLQTPLMSRKGRQTRCEPPVGDAQPAGRSIRSKSGRRDAGSGQKVSLP